MSKTSKFVDEIIAVVQQLAWEVEDLEKRLSAAYIYNAKDQDEHSAQRAELIKRLIDLDNAIAERDHTLTKMCDILQNARNNCGCSTETLCCAAVSQALETLKN